jgi:hypothetical protein
MAPVMSSWHITDEDDFNFNELFINILWHMKIPKEEVFTQRGDRSIEDYLQHLATYYIKQGRQLAKDSTQKVYLVFTSAADSIDRPHIVGRPDDDSSLYMFFSMKPVISHGRGIAFPPLGILSSHEWVMKHQSPMEMTVEPSKHSEKKRDVSPQRQTVKPV